MNSKMRAWQTRREVGITAFALDMKEMMDNDEAEIKLAYTGISKLYQIRSEFQHLFPVHAMTMTVWQRALLLKKLHTTSLSVLHSSCDGEFLVSELSVSADEADVQVPSIILAQMFKKAEEILQDSSTTISCAPCATTGSSKFSVVSEAGKRNNEVHVEHSSHRCSCTCRGFDVNKICSHSVAVAEHVCMLPDFLDWHRRTNQRSSLSRAAQRGVDPNRLGTKGGIKRRPSHKKK